MPHPLTLPTLSVLAVMGSGLGLYLGRAAVAEINPAYYSEAQDRFHADLTPYQSVGGNVRYAAGELGPAELDQALGNGCVGCRTYPEEYYPVHDTSEESYRAGWASMDEAPVVAAAAVQVEQPRAGDQPSATELAEQAVEEAQHAEAIVRVHRYSSYQVSAEAPSEPEQPAAVEQEAPATQFASAETRSQE